MAQNRNIKIRKFDDKIFIEVFLGQMFVRKHILLRQDLTPATYEALQGYISVYIERVGQMYIDQTLTTPESIKIIETLGVDTSNMTNTELSDELEKL